MSCCPGATHEALATWQGCRHREVRTSDTWQLSRLVFLHSSPWRICQRRILCNVELCDGRNPSSRQDQNVNLRRCFAERKRGTSTLSCLFLGYLPASPHMLEFAPLLRTLFELDGWCGIDVHTGRRAGQFLCPLGSCEEDELMPFLLAGESALLSDTLPLEILLGIWHGLHTCL